MVADVEANAHVCLRLGAASDRCDLGGLGSKGVGRHRLAGLWPCLRGISRVISSAAD